MVEIRELEVKHRAAAVSSLHSHIRGLGLDENGNPLRVADGLVGQVEARKAAGIVVEMIRAGMMTGKGILFVGPPGTGKTALAVAIARELGEDTPFVSISGAEIYSAEIKKTEALMRAVRKAMGVRIREEREVYEGVVEELKIRFVRNPFNPYVRVPVEARITLATKDDRKTLSVGEEITTQLVELRIKKGDIIQIDAETGMVTRIGRAKDFASRRRFDIEVRREVEVPKGPVKKVREITRLVTLHDLDLVVASRRITFSALFGVELEKEIDEEVRKNVNQLVKKMIDEGKAEIVPGVLFIDDAHILDLEAFTFLTKVLESEFSPILILATNRGISKIRGTDIESPHGIPLDLLDRLLIIPTRPYTKDEILEIVKIRADEEGVKLSDDALQRLADLGEEKSLRYAVQLLIPAKITAERRGRDEVTRDDVDEAASIFADVKESTELVRKYEELFIK